MYISKYEYEDIYDFNDFMKESEFLRLSHEAERAMDKHTTGVDGLKKLKVAFPAEEYDAEAVRYCTAKVIHTLYQIQKAEQSAEAARGYTETPQGLQRKIISRVESGNEAISYSEVKLSNSAIDAAVSDVSSKNALISGIIRECLSGVCDANGVQLLYMGQYPARISHV